MFEKIFYTILTIAAPFVLFDTYSLLKTNGPQQSHYVNIGAYWRYRPHASFLQKNEDGEDIKIQADQYGYRNEQTFDTYDIMLIGDSFVNAVNTKFEDNYTGQFIKAGFKTYNAGMDGTGTVHQLHILRDMFHHIKPKLLIINFFLGNDFKDNYHCAISENEDEDLASDKQITVKTDGHAPETYQKISLVKRLKMWIMDYSASARLLYGLKEKKIAQDMSYYDRAEILAMAYDPQNPNPDMQICIDKTKLALKKIKEHVAKISPETKIIVVGIPSKGQTIGSVFELGNFGTENGSQIFVEKHIKHIDFDNPDRLIHHICDEMDLPYISLLKEFRSNYHKRVFGILDRHWTAEGEQIAAQHVISYIQQKQILGG